MIESRTKGTDSIREKVDRKQIQRIDELTDLSGIRIIVYYQDDIDAIETIISENFEIDKDNSTNKSELYKSNEFGYLSAHYIISTNQERLRLDEWKNTIGLKAEIQVRTVLQHSWASISHELSYKKDYEIPKSLERKLFRLAGLFELADEEFLNIRESHKYLYDRLVEIDNKQNFTTQKIDLVTLKYLFQEADKYPIFEIIKESAESAGFKERGTSMKNDSFLSEINRFSKILELKHIEDLLNILYNNKNLYDKFFISLIGKNKQRVWFGYLDFYVGLALMLELNTEKIKYIEDNSKSNGWQEEILLLITKTIKEIKKL